MTAEADDDDDLMDALEAAELAPPPATPETLTQQRLRMRPDVWSVESASAEKKADQELSARLRERARLLIRTQFQRREGLFDDDRIVFDVSTVAGSGDARFADGKPKECGFYNPCQLAVDNDGNVFVADAQNHAVRRISPDGTVSTVFGPGPFELRQQAQQWLDLFVSQPPAPAALRKAPLRWPGGVAVDSKGSLYCSLTYTNRVAKFGADGTLALFAVCPCSRSSSKAASKAALLCNCTPRGVYQLALDEEANRLLVALATDDCLVSVDLDTGRSTIVAHKALELRAPSGVAICPNSGRVFVSDSKTVQSLHPRTFEPVLIASRGGDGFSDGWSGFTGDNTIGCVFGLAVDEFGCVLMADSVNNVVRRWTSPEHMARLVSLGLFAGEPLVRGLLGIISEYLGQGFVSTIAGSGHPSFADGVESKASFRNPRGVAIDKSGNIFVADTGNQRIRKLVAKPAASS